MITVSRRRFLALTGGFVATGCTTAGRFPSADPSTSTAPSAPPPPTTTPPGSSVVTTVTTPPELAPDQRILVLVELAGGNDAVNTVPPLTGSYRALRPTLALPEADLVTSDLLPGHALHPSLAPLVPFLDGGRLAVVAGIGYPDPDRSHFVATDRWLRADRMGDRYGWLGRWLDRLPDDLPALGATALGSGGALLLGADRRGTVIDEAGAFAFPEGLSHASIRSLTEPLGDDPLVAAAQQAFLASIGAVEEFDPVADAVRAGLPAGAPGGALSTGLAVAAQLAIGGVGTRVVTVKAGGFDTHSAQLAVHADLLADLATGLASFWATVDAAGMSDRILLATHSEFGRRVAENASSGCDHGAAGASLLMGRSVCPGLHGTIDTDDLLDGDLRPLIDPRTMFTACLDWLGADVEPILGRRYDEIPLLA